VRIFLSVALLLACILMGCSKSRTPQAVKAPGVVQQIENKMDHGIMTAEQIKGEIQSLEARQAGGELSEEMKNRLLMLKSMAPSAGNQLDKINTKAADNANTTNQMEDQMEQGNH